MSEVNEHIKLVLTSENPDWDPSSSIYAQQEIVMTNWKGEIRTRNKPNQEVLSFKFTLTPRPNKNTPTAQPECMNDWTNTTTPTYCCLTSKYFPSWCSASIHQYYQSCSPTIKSDKLKQGGIQ